MTREVPILGMGSAAAFAFLVSIVVAESSPFAARVVDYSPAPGQFVNAPAYGDATRALGPPTGGGLFAPHNESVVTLGGFGGSITLAFDHRVKDHPLNPLGLDAIVFGNAFFLTADGQTHYAECAVVEIAADNNGNGKVDDVWYLIPGSHIDPDAPIRRVQTWDDDGEDTTYPPAQTSWLPPGSTGMWETQAYALPSELFGAFSVRNPLYPSETEGVFGYAEYAPTLILGDLDGDDVVDDPSRTAEQQYTRPDDPFTVGIDLSTGGGDAFDIAWAVDPASGAPANLDGFDFIRISNPTYAVHGVLGENSPEIDAVSDVAPDLTGDADRDEDIDLRDLASLQTCMGNGTGGEEICDRLVVQGALRVGFESALILVHRMTGPQPE